MKKKDNQALYDIIESMKNNKKLLELIKDNKKFEIEIRYQEGYTLFEHFTSKEKNDVTISSKNKIRETSYYSAKSGREKEFMMLKQKTITELEKEIRERYTLYRDVQRLIDAIGFNESVRITGKPIETINRVRKGLNSVKTETLIELEKKLIEVDKVGKIT